MLIYIHQCNFLYITIEFTINWRKDMRKKRAGVHPGVRCTRDGGNLDVWLTPGGLAFLHSLISFHSGFDKVVSLLYGDGLYPVHRPVEWRLSGV